MILLDIETPKGCVYEDADCNTKYCPFCNHDAEPYCQFEDADVSIGICERPCYCPIVGEFTPFDKSSELIAVVPIDF